MATSNNPDGINNASCTSEELDRIISAPADGLTTLPDSAYDEVYPGIYVGEESFAVNLVELRRKGITHILNAAYGDTLMHSQTDPSRYRKISAEFLGVPAIDHMNFDLSPYFESSAHFIDGALKSGGKVLVHCVEGISRSSTLVIAYLMIKQNMNVRHAVRLVRKHRNIGPNEGFLQQLCKLNAELFKKNNKSEVNI